MFNSLLLFFFFFFLPYFFFQLLTNTLSPYPVAIDLSSKLEISFHQTQDLSLLTSSTNFLPISPSLLSVLILELLSPFFSFFFLPHFFFQLLTNTLSPYPIVVDLSPKLEISFHQTQDLSLLTSSTNFLPILLSLLSVLISELPSPHCSSILKLKALSISPH